MKTILSLRPNPECYEDEEKFKNFGINCIAFPMLEFKLKSSPSKRVLKSCSGTILTSKRAIKAIDLMIDDYDESFFKKPVFCIGKTTGMNAKNIGFNNVFSGNSNSKELVKLVKASETANNVNYLWLSGQQINIDLSKCFDKTKINLKRHKIYSMIEKKFIEPASLNLIKSGNIDGIMALSVRTLKNFKKLLMKYDLWDCHKNLNLFAISENVSSSIMADWKKRYFPDEPNTKNLVDIIKST